MNVVLCFCVSVNLKKIHELKIERSDVVCGLTSLNYQLYVGYDECNEIDVFDETFNKLSSIKIPELGDVNDMTSCSRYQCIYIADSGEEVIHRVDNKNKITRWSVDDRPEGLSVNSSHNLLVTCHDAGKVKEFTTDGQLLREIKLQQDIVYPRHTIQLTTDQFVVCHGWSNEPLNRVCIVNDAGKVLQSYGGKPESGNGQLNWPVRLAVMNGFIFVADRDNKRVLTLNSELTFIREILSNLSYYPWRIFIEEQTGRMFVSDWGQQIEVYSI